MSATVKKSIKKKLILILAIAIAIMAIIPLSSRGSEGGSATVKFKIDDQLYGQELNVQVGGEDSDQFDSKFNEEKNTTEYFLASSQFPEDPKKEGYTFVGWSDGEDVYTKDSANQLKITIGQDITLDAVFEEADLGKTDKQKDAKQLSDDEPVIKDGDLVLNLSGLNATKNDTLAKKADAALAEKGYSDAAEGYKEIKGLILSGTMTTSDFNFIKNNVATTMQMLDITKITNTDIPSRGLELCTALKQIKMNDDLTTLNSRAFYNCTSLEKIDLSKIESIGSNAFYACEGLSGSYSLKSLNDIGIAAFKECNGITAITDFELNSVKELEYQTFQNCTSLESIALDNITTLKGMNKEHNRGVFLGCTSLKDVGNTENLTYIGASAFKNCTALTKIDLRNVETLDSGGWETGSFSGCSALVEVGNTENLTYAGPAAFRDCTSLETVNISNVTFIGLDAFRSCESLVNLVGDMSSVESIGSAAFYNCVKLTGPFDLKNLKSLDHTAFKNCTVLTAIENFELNDVDVIAQQAFQNCTALKSINLSNVTAIDGNGVSNGYGSFANCTSLTDLGDTKKLESVGSNAFKSCKALEKMDLSGAKMIDADAFYNCIMLEKVTFPENASYGSKAFYGCALDMSSSNPSGGYPKGTYATDNPSDTFANQHPRAFFSLSATNAAIEVNGTYPNPAQIKTMYGHDYNDIIGAEWMNSAIKVAVKVTPDPVAIAKKAGKYDLTYTTNYSKMQLDNGVNKLDFKLTVFDVPPVLTPEDGTRDSAVSGSADFTSDKSGEYYYIVLDKDAAIPTAKDIVEGTKAVLLEGENSIKDITLNDSKEKIVYVIAKKGESEYSDIISIKISEWKWQLSVNVLDNVGGKISLNGGTFTADITSAAFSTGSKVMLSAKPDSGYVFAGWVNTSGGAFSTDTETKTVFTTPDNDAKATASFEKLIVTGGFVFKDKNGNGVFDKGTDEKYGKDDNVSVQLFKYEGNEFSTDAVMTTDVDDNGTYKFVGVTSGKYKVKAEISSPYKTSYSNEFTVKANEHLDMGENLAVQAEATLNVEFVDQSNQKVGDSVEVFGTNKDMLKDLTKNVNIKAISSDKVTNNNEVSVPYYDYYTIVGSDTKSAEYNWDDPETFNKTIEFELQSKADGDNGQLVSPGESKPSATDGAESTLNNGSQGAGSNVKDEGSSLIGDTGVPTFGFGDNKTPLYGNDSWALVNLLLAAGGIVVAILAAFVAFIRKTKKNELESNGADYESDEQIRKNKMLGILGTIILAVGGLVLFMITENMDLTMVLVNKWTIFNALIFAGEIVLSVFALRSKKNDFEGSVGV